MANILSLPKLLFPLLILGLSLSRPALSAEARNPWLDEVDPLMTPRERELFLGLAGDADRQAFIEAFWKARDPFLQTPRNEARERWEERLREARGRWKVPGDERALFYLLNGDPGTSFALRCDGVDLEVWTYEPRFQTNSRTTLFFRTGPDPGPARLWRPGDAPDLFAAGLECAKDEPMAQASLWLRVTGKSGYEVLAQRALVAPKPREWISSFRTASAEPRRSRSAPRPARLDVDFPGRQDDGWIRVLVETGALSDEVRAAGAQREVILTGRILRGQETVDSFRYRFDSLPAAAASPLAFERRLRPGQYKLEVQLEAPALDHLFVAERELAIPAAAAPSPAPPDPAPAAPVPALAKAPAVSPEVRLLFSEADASLAAPRPGLRILVPPGTLFAGVQSFQVRVDHAAGLPDEEQIERVAFSLDGKPMLTRTRPPYVAQLDLGKAPRTHRLRAEGINRRDEVVAVDEVVLNAGAQRFAVHLVEPRPDRAYRRSLRVRAEVEGPEDRNVERVELYLGESRVATLYQPPYAQPLVLPDAGIGYVRAVAYLADGTSAEDLVLLNSPAPTDKMDIRLIELYTNVVDGGGRPVEGLDAGAFQVFEDGVKQPVRLVERMQDTPLRLVTLIDNSASMQPRLEAARQAALEFLHRALKKQDQAAVVTFNRVPRVAASLTGDLGILEEGLSGLTASDETSLYDSLIFSLYYLGGAAGQRAVLLLSDGLDRTSRFQYDDVLECARRAGIAVYVIGIGLPRGEASHGLARLAAETGGRSFFLKGTGELGQAYQAIETDLRSRYRISYQSTNTTTSDAFRAVRVEMAKQGMEARTISGYYP
ncbi:MAG TPA: VWA domain-containing protein [Thermoanaerobaculia bacterium]